MPPKRDSYESDLKNNEPKKQKTGLERGRVKEKRRKKKQAAGQKKNPRLTIPKI